MIYTASSGVVRLATSTPPAVAEQCHECGRDMKDLGHWRMTGRVVMWRCVNRSCEQCAVSREPIRVPAFDLFSTSVDKTSETE